MHRNIDHLLNDPVLRTRISDSESRQDWSNAVSLGQTVDLEMKTGAEIRVKITAISPAQNLCSAKVLRGVRNEDEVNRIDDGEMVEFSRTKIRHRGEKR